MSFADERKPCGATEGCTGHMRKVTDNTVLASMPPKKQWWWYCPKCEKLADGGYLVIFAERKPGDVEARLKLKHPTLKFMR